MSMQVVAAHPTRRNNPSSPSSIPTFRSLRNLLPFRPPKHNQLPPNPPPKSPFATFGSIRRSFTLTPERNPSFSAPRPDTHQSPVISIHASHKPDLPPSPEPTLSADLSTIVEADTSGISKRMPADDHALPENLPQPQDTSLLDLSTSDLTVQVLDAMRVKDLAGPTDWLAGANAVIVDNAPDDPSDDRADHFNLDLTDPDLHLLLRPNRSVRKGPSLFTSSHSSDDTTIAGRSNTNSATPSPGHDLYPGSASPQPSSMHKTPPLSRSTPSRAHSASALPRLRVPKATSASSSASPDSALFDNSPGRRSSDSNTQRQQLSPPSPLASNAAYSARYPSAGEHPARKPQSRLATPARHATSPSTRRLPPRHLLTASPTAPASRRASPVDADVSRRYPRNPRPSLDSVPRPDVAARDRAFLLRSRKRSMSVEARSDRNDRVPSTPAAGTRPASSLASAPPAADWLGPRTAKAFAAAGLLDWDRDAPASVSSYGRRGSVSRTLTASDARSSPTFSAAPRTAFSGSTAPTSVSSAPSTVQALREKHELATEALLSALADSQRAAKALRDENGALRARVRGLEAQLRERPLLAHPVPRWAFDAHERAGSSSPPPDARRRFSGTSSVFPVPPSNMTLLLHDGGGAGESVSPMTADFSMTDFSMTEVSLRSGSPGSLYLRPEHAVHLGDLASLELGRGADE